MFCIYLKAHVCARMKYESALFDLHNLIKISKESKFRDYATAEQCDFSHSRVLTACNKLLMERRSGVIYFRSCFLHGKRTKYITRIRNKLARNAIRRRYSNKSSARLMQLHLFNAVIEFHTRAWECSRFTRRALQSHSLLGCDKFRDTLKSDSLKEFQNTISDICDFLKSNVL